MRIKENFFDGDEIKILESMPDGYLYSNILLKMYLNSLKNSGRLMLNEYIPYSPEMIASITRHQIGTVQRALEIFKKMGLIEVLDNGAIYMLNIQQYIGKSSDEADRKREYRQRIEAEKKALLKGEDKCPTNVREISDKRVAYIDTYIDTDIELKKDTDIDTEKKGIKQSLPPKHKNGTYQNVLLSDKEIEKLDEELGPDKAKAVIDNFSELKEMKGYKYKSDYLAIKKWGIEAYNQKCKPVHKEQYTDEEYKAGSMDPEKESF
jgi:predicted phage replisome organizer